MRLTDNYNLQAMEEAKKAGVVVSHDRTPQPGDDERGERMSSLPYREEDLPNTEVDLGDTDISSESVEHDSPVESLPESVSAAQIRRESFKRDPFGGDR